MTFYLIVSCQVPDNDGDDDDGNDDDDVDEHFDDDGQMFLMAKAGLQETTKEAFWEVRPKLHPESGNHILRFRIWKCN